MRSIDKEDIAKYVCITLFDLTVAFTVYEFAQRNDSGVKLDF